MVDGGKLKLLQILLTRYACICHASAFQHDLMPSGKRLTVAESFKLLKERLLCEWLEKAIVRRVIASLDEQKGRHNIRSCFTDKAVAQRLVDSCLERMDCRSNLISCTISSLSMLADLLTGWGSW